MNINNIYKALFAGAGLFLFASCEKGVNDKIVTPPAYSEFGTSNLLGKYFITNSPSSVFKIPVGITNVTNADRTIQLTLTSPTGAVAGTQYTAPASILIPAGKSVDSLAVKGLFAGYPTGRRDTLRITITGGDVPANTYNNTYNLVMQKYCDVTLAGLSGSYTNTRETNSTGGSPYGPYTVKIKNLQSLTATTAKGLIENLWDSGLDDLEIYFDWTDPSNFTVSMPQQYTGLDYDIGQPLLVRTSPGQPNSFSSCDQSISLTVDFIVSNYPTPGSSAYYSRNYKINIKR
jgi:hypothetical protein